MTPPSPSTPTTSATAPDRQADQAAAHRPHDPGRRRHARRPGVRHRRGQGDPGARPERLRDRPAARPAVASPSWTSAPSSPSPAPSRAWTGWRRAPPSSPRCAPRAGSSPRSGRTSTPSATARAARPPSSRGCPCSGGSRSARWPRPPATRSATAGSRSTRRRWRSGTSTGSTTSTTGASRASCGGATASRSGTARTARSSASARTTRRPPARAGPRTPMSWTPGSPPACGRSPPSAGPNGPPSLAKFYPNSVLVTGYDILFFWVARMMMFGLYAMDGTPPFHTIALHGMVRDQFGKKMSKSFGNAVNPLDWMDKYGSDAVRFTLARGANPGVDVPDRRGLGPGVAQLRQQDLERHPLRADERRHGRGRHCRPPSSMSATDRWILSRLNADGRRGRRVLRRLPVREAQSTRSSTSRGTRSSTGTSSCPRPRSSRAARQAEVSGRVLGEVLDVTLRLLHPIVPFVTETLWTTLTGSESVVIADWPARQRLPRRRRPSRRSSSSSRSSPRSAGSAPTRASSPARRSRPG